VKGKIAAMIIAPEVINTVMYRLFIDHHIHKNNMGTKSINSCRSKMAAVRLKPKAAASRNGIQTGFKEEDQNDRDRIEESSSFSLSTKITARSKLSSIVVM
jgi:hypothetical protein